MKLVVTPKPLAYESLMGYALHLTEANGYPSISYVTSALNGRWYGSTIGRLDAAPLAEMAHLEPAEIERLTMRPSARPRAFVRVFGHDLPSAEVSSREPKICPLCLKEGRRCEGFWELTQAVACPRHSVELVSICPQCAKQLRWARKRTNQCKCGADLTAWPAGSVSTHLADLMGLLRAMTYRDQLGEPIPTQWRHLQHLTLRQLCKLTWTLSCVVQGDGMGRGRSKARRNYRRELNAVAHALSDWPHNFRLFLADRYNASVSNSQSLPSFHRLFAWLKDALIKNVEGGATAFQFVRDEVHRFAAQHWTRSTVARDSSDALAPDLTFRWGTYGEACDVTGLHILTLQKLVRAGEIKSKKVATDGTRATVVDLEHARAFRQSQSRHPAACVRRAAKQVGVSIETLKAMCDSGLYQRNHRATMPQSLTVEDVAALAARLNGLLRGKRLVHAEGITSLDQALTASHASPAEKATVYERLLQDPDLVVGRRTKGPGLGGRLQVMAAAIETLVAGMRDNDVCVTVRVAAKQLECADAVITGLKRAGHLQCRTFRGRIHPCRASVNHFDEAYESLSRVSRRMGVPIKRIYARFDFAKVQYIRVRTAQYVTMFVRRSDIQIAETLIRNLA